MQRSSRRFLVSALLGSSAALALASPAIALGISPDPAGFDLTAPDVAGSVALLDVVAGTPSGGIVLAGSVDPGDVTLVFELGMTRNALGNLSVFTFTGLETAVGTIAGGGVDVTSGSLGPLVLGFSGAGVSAGQTSDPFFVSYSDLPVGTTLSFEAFAGLVVLTTATVVPEPGTGSLLAVGLAALGIARRGRSG